MGSEGARARRVESQLQRLKPVPLTVRDVAAEAATPYLTTWNVVSRLLAESWAGYFAALRGAPTHMFARTGCRADGLLPEDETRSVAHDVRADAHPDRRFSTGPL